MKKFLNTWLRSSYYRNNALGGLRIRKMFAYIFTDQFIMPAFQLLCVFIFKFFCKITFFAF